MCGKLMRMMPLALATLLLFGCATPESFPVPRSWPVEDEAIRNDYGRLEGVRPIWIEGAEYCGRPTRVFAWYGLPKGASPEHRVPAMVLIHGGGGTAFAHWVKMWTDRGYAAIAMDTCGGAPRGERDGAEHPRHEWSGPWGWGDQRGYTSENLADHWPQQAITAVANSHSFLRSLPEVDENRIGVTGISWGGYLTSIVAGLDHRYKFAAPVYGCGWYDLNPIWKVVAGGGERYQQWLEHWDARNFIGGTTCPVLRCNGDRDYFYTVEMTMKSMAALSPKVPAALSLKPKMLHGHPPYSGDPAEISAFADYYLKDGTRPLAITGSQFAEGKFTVTFDAHDEQAVAATLYYLLDTTPPNNSREWFEHRIEQFDATSGRVEVEVPAAAKICYLNLLTSRGHIYTALTELPTMTQACEAGAVNGKAD